MRCYLSIRAALQRGRFGLKTSPVQEKASRKKGQKDSEGNIKKKCEGAEKEKEKVKDKEKKLR